MDKTLRQCYARYMRLANKAINDYYTRKLRPTGVAIVQFSMLFNVNRLGTCSIGELADACELDYTTVTRSIRPLVERGFLVDLTEGRGRRRCLELTEAGRAAVETGTPLWEEAQADVRALLGENDVERLKAALLKLEALDERE